MDVVVLDAHDQPVRGLTKQDFTVLEDGHQQTIVGFEARDLEKAEEAASPGPKTPSPTPSGASNEDALSSPARVFALLIDDLGISPAVMQQVRPALARWISEQADPRDELTITTTSGGTWWSDLVARGREDLLAVLNRIQGKLPAPSSLEAMSDWEAYQVAVAGQGPELGEGLDRSRPVDGAGTVGGGVKLLGSSALERVTQRWLDSHVCPPCTDPHEPPADCREVRECRRRVQALAGEIHTASMRRSEAIFGSVANLSRSLAGAPGRKSILLVSEQLIKDTDLGVSLRNAIDASQRGNTALYFLGARGLAGTSLYGADQSNSARPQDVGVIATEESVLATAGGVDLAEATGGAAVTTSNDFAAGLARMASDSSAYSLLGYQPAEAPDGKWHRLEVRVARPQVKVLSRKGYLAASHGGQASALAAQRPAQPQKDTGVKAAKRPLAPALLTGSVREGVPLRMAAYVEETNGAGLARVQVVIEIDNSHVQVDRSMTPWKASLDLTIMAASPFRPPAVPVDERMDLSLGPSEVDSGWWLVPRVLWLPAGLAQLRVYVRDRATGQAGIVSERLVVPDVDQPYLSTPILSDRTLPPLKPGDPPRLVPVARRQFGKGRPLYCQFEVHTFGGQDLPGVAQLQSSYALQKPDGQQVAAGPATPIRAEGHHATRRIVLPTEGLEDGPYLLILTVEDRLAHRTLVARAPFVLAEPESASSPPTAHP